MRITTLTKANDWDCYWSKSQLSNEICKGRNKYLDEILDIFDKFFPKNKELDILEIGGASGQFLIYIKKNFNCKISALDYSEVGCINATKNFKRLNVQGAIYKRDIFSDLSDIPKFDIVYSLGFIEHFYDLEDIIKRHLDLLRPGGILLIGTPNFSGLNRLVLERMDPQRLKMHNLASMDTKNWEIFEKHFNLEILFKGYICGFDPSIYRCKKRTILNVIMYEFFVLLSILLINRLRIIRKINSKYWSAYAIGVYRKTN